MTERAAGAPEPPIPASDRVRREWANRVEAEYRSSALTAQLLHRLIMLGVSPDTLATAQRIVSDELAHAEISREVLLAAGGTGAQIRVNRRTLELPDLAGASLEQTTLRLCGRLFCCGETVAVPLFRALREHATVEPAAAALDRILADEAVHRAFGWDLLDELIEIGGEPVRAAAQQWVGGWVDSLRRGYPEGSDACDPADRAWGLMSVHAYARIREACIQDTILPWFARRGVHA